MPNSITLQLALNNQTLKSKLLFYAEGDGVYEIGKRDMAGTKQSSHSFKNLLSCRLH